MDTEETLELLRGLAVSDFQEEIRDLFADAQGQDFEPGMETHFSRMLVVLTEVHGSEAVKEIGRQIDDESLNDNVAGEALRWLGDMEDGPAYESRRELLEKCLSIDSAVIKDCAALGLASLDDPHAIPFLEIEIEQESRGILCQDLQQVLDQLIDTRMSREKAKAG